MCFPAIVLNSDDDQDCEDDAGEVGDDDEDVVNTDAGSCDPYSGVYSHEQEGSGDGEEDDLGD